MYQTFKNKAILLKLLYWHFQPAKLYYLNFLIICQLLLVGGVKQFVSDQYCPWEQAEKQYARWIAGEAMRNAEAIPPSLK